MTREEFLKAKAEFLSEYDALCHKFNVYIYISEWAGVAEFEQTDHDRTLAELREEGD